MGAAASGTRLTGAAARALVLGHLKALDPWAREADEEELPGMPMTIGPADSSGTPASGVDLNSGAMSACESTSLVEALRWDIPSGV